MNIIPPPGGAHVENLKGPFERQKILQNRDNPTPYTHLKNLEDRIFLFSWV